MPYQLAWFIYLLPMFSFIIVSFLVKPFARPESKVSGYITIGAIAASLALSLWLLITVMGSPEHVLESHPINWVVIGDFTIKIGMLLNSLTAVMLIVVTVVSLMVQIYSQGYMHGDPGYHRYYAFMSLFTASMIGLVLADNLLFMFVFWEMVGLCSYLLIGFWFHRPSAANAAKKAFIVTRLGDFGFLAGILVLYATARTLDINELNQMAVAGTLAGAALTWAAIGIFSGAAGKSAQFPLHVWLPDAMEGPTPVSALIHAATMVAAGVFLVARTLPLFEASGAALTTVAVIGGFTAIFAASMGVVMHDIKRVVAYSTISQLGYMMLGLATGGVAVGIFHLFNHAFFKALLFLGSGSVNHTTGTFDMRLMGGLKKAMPWTYATFVIAALSLAGIWPLAGFWSKDEILASAQHEQPFIFWLAMATVFMTAFYIFRVVFLTFHGEYRGAKPEEHAAHGHGGHGGPHLHESGRVMVAPLVILCVFAIGSGWLNLTGGFNAFLGEEAEGGHSVIEGLFGVFTHPLPVIALLVALFGIFTSYAIYKARWLSAENIGKALKPIHTVLYRKYFFDELYENVIVGKLLMGGLFAGFQMLDSRGVDGLVNGAGLAVTSTGGAARKAQTGQLQLYGLFMGLGVVVIAIFIFLFG